MTLTDRITGLRDETLSLLNAAHNYHAHTRDVWRLVQQMVREGQRFTIRNQVTGSTVDETELSGLAQEYVTDYLASATFQHFVSLFERFVSDFLCAWLTEYPGSLSESRIRFRTVLDAGDRDEIVAAVVRKEVHGLSYQRVADWFAYLEKIAQLGCPSQDQIGLLAEIKASRDVLVHNNGIVNPTYLDKSAGRARFADGDRLELPEHYHRRSWQLIRQVVSDVSDAGMKKLGK